MEFLDSIIKIFGGALIGACGSSLFYVIRYGDRITKIEVQLAGVNNCIERLSSLIDKMETKLDALRLNP